MSKESDGIRKEIAALEAELDKREKPTHQATEPEDEILAALDSLSGLVKSACGESFMEDDDDEAEMSYSDDEAETSYSDDEAEMSYSDDLVDEPIVLDDEFDFEDDLEDDLEDDIVYASEYSEDIEEEINQDYLDEVLEEVRPNDTITTDDSMLDAAPTGYVARLKSASSRLDKVANYLEKQGNPKLAERIDMIADAIDTRIQQEASNV